MKGWVQEKVHFIETSPDKLMKSYTQNTTHRKNIFLLTKKKKSKIKNKSLQQQQMYNVILSIIIKIKRKWTETEFSLIYFF